MVQQDTHILYQDRKLWELCQDINFRAEEAYLKLSNKGKNILLIAVVVLLGLLALAWHFQWSNFNWHMVSIVLAVITGWGCIICLVNKLLINGMKRATSPKQHLRLAKCLKWWVKLSRAMLALLALPWPTLSLLEDGQYGIILLIAGPLLLLYFLTARVDTDFSEGLDELEYRLEE